VEMTLLDVAAGGTPLTGAAVYLWHCDMAGRYSLYDQEISGENYLRGVQESDGDGNLSFRTIFPAAYMGRWPHIHFEVYESLDAATQGSGKLRTSQIAIPEEICQSVYATEGYEQSVTTWARRRSTPTWCSATATRASWRP
jgi:protocatechuate 3,4-dioxygenase beta subunit